MPEDIGFRLTAENRK